jgi:putative membrane protein
MSTWHRLHPLSPAVRAGRALIAIAVIFLPTLVSGGTNSWDVAWHFIAVGALVVLGVVSWLVTRWQIDGNDLRIETGLLRRSSLRYPLSQVQAIDTVRPGLARALGLAELRLRMGGTGGAARLAYLPVVQANALRARLLALSQGAHEETPEPIDHELVRVPPGRVAVSLLLSGPAVVLVVYLAALAAASSAGKHGLVAVTLPILIADAIAIWRRFNRSYHATVAEAPEGLRVRSGLVETTAETIPRGRVQAVLLIEPFLWRPFGWCRLEVDVAGRVRDRSDAERGKRRLRTLLPVGTRAEAERLLALLVPGAPEPAGRPPRRARWKSPLRYRQLSFGFDERYAVTTGGRVARTASWVPLTKVQSLRRVEGPTQRRLRLATVYLDTAGKNFGAAFRDLDERDSQTTLDRLTDLARMARRA